MRELLFSITRKDFEIQHFKSGGKGGQHQNTTDSGCRIIHKESGLVAESRSERSFHQNKKIAFKRLMKNPKMKLWINQKVFEIDQGKTLDQIVEQQMEEINLQIEIKKDGVWIKQ